MRSLGWFKEPPGNRAVGERAGKWKFFQSPVVSDVMGRGRVCQRRDLGLGVLFPSEAKIQTTFFFYLIKVCCLFYYNYIFQCVPDNYILYF